MIRYAYQILSVTSNSVITAIHYISLTAKPLSMTIPPEMMRKYPPCRQVR